MSTKIKRYDIFPGYGDYAYVDRDETDDGSYVSASDLIELAKQFPKDHVVRATLLEALGEVDE